MKPFYVVLLIGAAAVGGGLVVRYTEHPVEVALAHSIPPTVVAPPIPPTARVGPSTSVPVHAAPPRESSARESSGLRATAPDSPRQTAREATEKAGKPSALSPALQADHSMRVRIPPDPPAVTMLERSTVAPRVPVAVVSPPPIPAAIPAPIAPKEMASAQAPEPLPVPIAPPPPAPLAGSQANHATLKAGIVISVRINEALSSNLNSAGDVFSGTLDRPLIADGFVIAERGARVRGEVVDSKASTTGQGLPELTIRLREIVASDGQRVHLVSESWRKMGLPPTGNDRSGRAGSVYDVALTRGGAAVIRPATSIPFRLSETVELTEKR